MRSGMPIPTPLLKRADPTWGLPDGQMGNSEVGHLTIGAGRIIRQELVRISETVREKRLGSTSALQSVAERLRSTGGTLHLLGLCSDGGVHSHVDHVCGTTRMGCRRRAQDCGHPTPSPTGEDTPTQSAPTHLSKIQDAISSHGIGRISSLCGRYWAMDRDHRWERTERAHTLLTDPDVELHKDEPSSVLASSYANGITDEFLEPVRLSDDPLRDGDALLMFNFRPDRARQIVQALSLAEFEGFKRVHQPSLDLVTFTQYEN